MGRNTPRNLDGLSAAAFLALKNNDATKADFHAKVPARHNPAALPRVIHMFWDTGFDTAPQIVRLALKSWQVNNPGWRFNLLDAESARDVVDRDGFARRPAVAGYSDLLRLALLRQQGGVWADATVLCQQPLDAWLPALFNDTGFMAFRRPGVDRILSSWFLAAVPEHELIRAWEGLARDHWTDPMIASGPYFWAHYLFEYLVLSSPKHRRMWRAVPQMNASPLHQLIFFLIGLRSQREGLDAVVRTTPMQKLTHKHPVDMPQLQEILTQSRPDLAEQLF